MEWSQNRPSGIQKQSQIKNNSFQSLHPVKKGILRAVHLRIISSPRVLARTQPIDMSLPGEQETFRISYLLKRNNRRRFVRKTSKIAAVSMVIMLLFGGAIFSQGYLKLHKVFRGGTASAAALKVNVNPNLLKGEGSGRVNILLLGRGGGNHEGPDLTDSLMVVSIDPVNNKAILISIPRDLWVNLPNGGDMKINAAWETGEFKYLGKQTPGSTDPKAIAAGFSTTDQVVQQILGININYNAIVNFQAFQQAVDTLGGVTVNVPSDLVDPTMAWQNKGNPVLASAGTQTFNGAKALLYARSRETSSDFARAQRQRDLHVAIENKALSLGTLSNPIKISGLANAFGKNVATDISVKDASTIYNIFKNIGTSNITSLDLNSGTSPTVTTGNMVGQSIVLPSAGLFNYSQIQSFVASKLIDPYITKENAKILVLNGSNVPGLATNLSNTLKTYGYDVLGTANTQSNYQTDQIIDVNNSDPYTEHYLENRLKVKATTKAPNNIQTNGADFVIIIGSNEADSSQTQAN
jgi:LCP family protein required for cell wall assembly